MYIPFWAIVIILCCIPAVAEAVNDLCILMGALALIVGGIAAVGGLLWLAGH